MKKLSERTITKNAPISRRKAKFYNALVGLYNAMVESAEETPEMSEISAAIEHFQNGHYLPPKSITATNRFGAVAVNYLPTHRRKVALYTNLVEYINNATSQELTDLDDENVSEEVKRCADELVKVVNAAFFSIAEKVRESEETTTDDQAESEPEYVRVSVVVPAEYKDRLEDAITEFDSNNGGVVRSYEVEDC